MKQILEQFKSAGTTDVQIVQNETLETMKAVFEQYSDKYFHQKDFVVLLKRSNPFINHQLHALLKAKTIERFGTKRQYSYRKTQ